MAIEASRILVSGVVQGVGFRPFVYRIAHEHGLVGSVRNLGDAGVEIHVEGPSEAIRSFLECLKTQTPPLARIDAIKQESCQPLGVESFAILPSTNEGAGAGQLPPDVATCPACVDEILGSSRFQGYWATSCTDCGPRFTVIESLPYDRPRTSMSAFPMCENCQHEYTNPLERRYHAQTTACDACGPTLEFDGDATLAVEQAIQALARGRIVAIKGIGGTHLACDATNHQAVNRLRQRLGRSNQPFAVMATERMLADFVELGDRELSEMQGWHRPILVLRKKSKESLPGVAPGLHTVGVMLPYTGLHHLLFQGLQVPLAMTSANRPGQPMLIDNADIVERLEGICDHFLLHNRKIVARCDDSVERLIAGSFTFLRRSRGLVPQGLERDLGDESILALGPETDLTFALYDRGRVTLSQHIGNVDDVDTFAFLQQAVAHLQRITRARVPSVIACDAHPQFLTSHWANALAANHGARVVKAQHHAAHLASVMLEHDFSSCVGIVLDGYGYGADGTAWGGEILAASERLIQRVGSLWPVGLPGGDLAARSPLRMAASFLSAATKNDDDIARALLERGMGEVETSVLLRQLATGLNVPLTTSAGRFLDAVSAWLGVGVTRSYEGEPAMRLEALASQGHAHDVTIRSEKHAGLLRLDTVDLFAQLSDMAERFSASDVAATAQDALARGMTELALQAARERGISAIALSGGVGYNDAIASRVRQCCEEAGLRFFAHHLVPCGDGGVCLGQAAMAGLDMELVSS